MSGCVSLGATAVMLLVIYYMVRAFTNTSGSSTGGGAGGPPANQGPQDWGTDPATGRQVKVQIKGGDQWQWANIKVPMARQMPPGLIIGVRPNPRVPLQQGAMDERAFYAIADAVGKAPEGIVEWATPENRHSVLTAWWQVRQGFQLRGNTVTANLPVQHGQDPRIHQAVGILSDMARELSEVPEAVVSSAVEAEPPPVESAEVVAAARPEPQETPAPAPAPRPAPEPKSPVEAPAPASAPAGLESAPAPTASEAPTPTAAPVAVRAPSPSSLDQATSGLGGATASPFAAAAAASRPPSGSGWPGESASPASQPAPSQAPQAAPSPFAASSVPSSVAPPSATPAPNATPAPAPSASVSGSEAASEPDTPAPVDATASQTSGDLGTVLSEVIALDGGPAQETAVKEQWVGKTIAGSGKVSFSSKIYGTDMDLGESDGFKITLDVPVEGAGVISPKALLHVAEDPGDSVKFGATIDFEGEIAGYKAMGKTLLLKKGRIR